MWPKTKVRSKIIIKNRHHKYHIIAYEMYKIMINIQLNTSSQCNCSMAHSFCHTTFQ